MRYVDEICKYVQISGLKNVKIEDVEEFLSQIRREKNEGIDIQLFDASLIATWEHLYFAVLNGQKAFRNKMNISKNVEMEIMLYASAQRQIRKAIDKIGIKPSSSDIALILIGEKPENLTKILSVISMRVNSDPDETVLELSKEKVKNIRAAFNISETEIQVIMKNNNAEQALVDLVIERMALLPTQL